MLLLLLFIVVVVDFHSFGFGSDSMVVWCLAPKYTVIVFSIQLEIDEVMSLLYSCQNVCTCYAMRYECMQ